MEFLIDDKPEKDFLPYQKIIAFINKLPDNKLASSKAIRETLGLKYSEWAWFRDCQKYSKYIYKEKDSTRIFCGKIKTIEAYTKYRKDHE